MKAGYIPATHALINWDDSGPAGAQITEVVVCDIHNQPPWVGRLINSRGASDLDWLDGQWHSSPIGLFLSMAVSDGFANPEIKIIALKEFAKIAGQEEWTRGLLAELGFEDEDERN